MGGKLAVMRAFLQANGMAALLCKTVGSGYVGSNPTPATV
jgi:hypothetical protein